jgi:hypothetical protein
MSRTGEMRCIILLAAFNGSPNHRDPDGKARFANPAEHGVRPLLVRC